MDSEQEPVLLLPVPPLADDDASAPAERDPRTAEDAAGDAPAAQLEHTAASLDEPATPIRNDTSNATASDSGAAPKTDFSTATDDDSSTDDGSDPGATDRPPAEDETPVPDPSLDDTLSPAVRRLVRQYDLDVTAIHGSGPSGRIRVSDVMAHLGGRTYTPQEIAAAANADADTAPGRRAATAEPDERPARSAARFRAAPVTTLFECELTNVLAHRRELRKHGTEPALTSYFLVAVGEALRAVPEVADASPPVNLGAVLCLPDGRVQSSIVGAGDGAALESLADRLLAVDKALRFSARYAAPNARLVDLLVHHHGTGGSLVATPTPIGEEHVASVGVGRVRREIAIREEDQTPRVAHACYVSLSFLPDRIELARANRFLAQLVRVLEHWPH